ncbi:lymphotoxin beta receptor inhibitor-like isoform X2 [Battus philenor]|uniref:lymphotoxin beta receptor inhibitor-like isoform X2 n=1 Tax=Battus philenor TaxID=42288 RepID=UPI0035CF4FED
MLRLLFLVAVIPCTISQQYQQKVAPGVPPQNYQNYQPPPPPPQPIQTQQQYQPQQQQQYQPQQMQQQHYQQQVPVQQIPVQVAPQGHAHHGDPQLLNPANIAQERDHIQEHMDVPIDTSKMSEQELQFHYFKMHDADNNDKLDGCELIKSLIHWHEQGHKQQPQPGSPPVGEKIFSDDELTNLIDPILNMDDHNRDGYIDYPEFVRAQQKSQNKDH